VQGGGGSVYSLKNDMVARKKKVGAHGVKILQAS
jgi:hypothetical protein